MGNSIHWTKYSIETIFKMKHADNFKNTELKLRQECLKQRKKKLVGF